MNRILWVSLWFQLIWFVAVLGQEDWQWLTLLLAVITLLYAAATDARSLKSIMVLGVAGIGLDWLNILSGVLVFEYGSIPIWLGVLWLSFIWYAKQWTPHLAKYNKQFVVVFVGVCGALSYWAGSRFSAVAFSYPLHWTLLILGLQWCGMSWLIMRVFADEDSSSKATGDTNASAGNKS